MNQTRLRYVKNQMANFEISLCADQKSYKNHDDPKDLSRVITLKRERKGRKDAYIKSSLPFSASLRGGA